MAAGGAEGAPAEGTQCDKDRQHSWGTRQPHPKQPSPEAPGSVAAPRARAALAPGVATRCPLHVAQCRNPNPNPERLKLPPSTLRNAARVPQPPRL